MNTGSAFLLDTHTFVWLAVGDDRVSAITRQRLAAPGIDLWLSVASVWELAIKTSLGKAIVSGPLQELIDEQVQAMRLRILDVQIAHALAVEQLPFHHRDPFDRLLISQAMSEELPIVSKDTAFDAYAVERVW